VICGRQVDLCVVSNKKKHVSQTFCAIVSAHHYHHNHNNLPTVFLLVAVAHLRRPASPPVPPLTLPYYPHHHTPCNAIRAVSPLPSSSSTASSALRGPHAWILDRSVFATAPVLSSSRFRLGPPRLQRHRPRTGEGQDPVLRCHHPPHPRYISPCPRHVRDSDPSPGPPGTARAPLTRRILVYDALELLEFS
jgi:hypothetical protein